MVARKVRQTPDDAAVEAALAALLAAQDEARARQEAKEQEVALDMDPCGCEGGGLLLLLTVGLRQAAREQEARLEGLTAKMMHRFPTLEGGRVAAVVRKARS